MVGVTDPRLSGEEIVISGISGAFPASENVQQFMENLYNKVDMVHNSESKTNTNYLEVPKYVGKARGMKYFDTTFFKVPRTIGVGFDAMCGKVLEQTFCALFDAGVNPQSVTGKSIGVFVGSSFDDIYALNVYEISQNSKYVISGASKAMLANRISYWLDLKGPSFCIDGSCSSSTTCLTAAYRSIKNGHCESAIVAGCNHCQHPILSANMTRAGFLCADGKTKCFDKKGDGYVRSEAISVFFLQKAKHAKRIYSEVFYADEKYFAKPDNLFQPARDVDDIVKFLDECYTNAKVSPSDVEYVEANGAGLAVADAAELEAIGRFFAKDKPVLVGCVRSNMGHAEPASGICGAIKICLAYHKGQVAGNIHYDEPLDTITAVKEGKVRVLTENTLFNRRFTALNSFSYTGNNYHILLKGHYKAKDNNRYLSPIPRLVLASGRVEHCVERITNLLKSSPIDPEQISLLHDVFESDLYSHLARGYIVLDVNDKNETECLAENIAHYPDVKRPVCFLFSGMGSQWPEMGTDLLRIPTFFAAIQRCHKALQSRNVDVFKIITNPEESSLNIFNSIIAITAVQIGLTDILKELGIVPDTIIGHSVGEVACAYADGALTAEEAILASYSRGIVSYETKFIRGTMAAVGLAHEEVQSICPPEIVVACHNSRDSTTISGPEDIVKGFLEELTNRGIFAKEVQTSNIAFHSKYIAEAGPKLLSEMTKIITKPKLRSKKWIPSSVPPKVWHTEAANLISAQYFTTNLLSPVYFEEAAEMVPKDAVVIEIAPHGLLQAIVKKSLSECIHVPLTKRKHKQPVNYLLEAIGKLYQAGLNPHVSALYPKVEYPVSTETPLLSHFVSWEHSDGWQQTDFKSEDLITMAGREVVINIQDDEWKYLEGNIKNGRNVFPESAYLVLVWETLAMYRGTDYKIMPVIFEKLIFHKELEINKDEIIKLGIAIHKGNYYFEVTSADNLIASGLIKNVKRIHTQSEPNTDINDESFLDKNNIYSLLNKRGYMYKNHFQLIETLSQKQNKANLKWDGNYVTFIDALIQVHLLGRKYEGMSVPKSIKKLSINVNELRNNYAGYFNIDINNKLFTSTRGAGIHLEDIVFEDKTHVTQVVSGMFSSVTGHEKIKVAYVGLPLNISKNELNIIDNIHETILIDFSGYDKNGERIMGILPYGSVDELAEAKLDLLWPIPQDWTLEDAATVLLPYVLAYYCLVIKGKLHDKRGLNICIDVKRQNKNVLVTNGDNAFGQAAIAVALAANCSVYTTVNSDHKKQFLLKLFPQLQEINVVTTKDDYFYADLLYNSDKELFDHVINNESGEFRKSAMKCVAPCGCFFDISKRDKEENDDFGMFYFGESKHYATVNLENVLRKQNYQERQALLNLISENITRGIIKPFSRKVYEADEVQTVIEMIDPNQEAGRFLFKINDANTILNGNDIKNTDGSIKKTSLLNKTKLHNENGATESFKILSSKKYDSDTIDGFGAFYSFIDENEWAATNPLAHMPSLYNKIFVQGKEEMSPDDAYLFMIPGFEGHSRVYKSICERLKIQAFTMQIGPDMSENNFPDIASTMFSHIKRIFHLKSKFYLFGYSFGVNIALELATLFEKDGHTGVIFCLDSGPDILKNQIQAYLGDLTDVELQDVVIKHMYNLISGKNPDELDQYLMSIESWTEKCEMCVNALKGEGNHSHEYIKLILNSAYKRMLLPKEYKPTIKLQSKIVLIKGIPHPKLGKHADDYYLSKYTVKPVQIVRIDADHASAPENCTISNIVNKMLDHTITETFKNTNQCVKYKVSK